MPDMEKVINGLQCCTSYEKCDECPYEEYKDPYAVICMDKMHTDALNVLKEREEAHKILVEMADKMYAMLKEQKAVKPVLVGNMWECGNCHAPVGIYLDDIRDDFCRKCGKAVKWNDL